MVIGRGLVLLWNFSNSLQIKTPWIRQKELDNRISVEMDWNELACGCWEWGGVSPGVCPWERRLLEILCNRENISYHRRTTSTFLSHKNVKYADNKTPIPNVYYYTCKKINDRQVSCWTDTAESLQAKYERWWIKNNHCQPKPIFLMQSSELRTRFHFYHIILFCLMLWIMINLSEVLVTSYNLRTS